MVNGVQVFYVVPCLHVGHLMSAELLKFVWTQEENFGFLTVCKQSNAARSIHYLQANDILPRKSADNHFFFF
jgi:hypothetical protein